MKLKGAKPLFDLHYVGVALVAVKHWEGHHSVMARSAVLALHVGTHIYHIGTLLFYEEFWMARRALGALFVLGVGEDYKADTCFFSALGLIVYLNIAKTGSL
jgi:hypothetical protein